MTPRHFPEANVALLAPPGMTEAECGTLHACRTSDGYHISKWTLSWRERVRVLFTGTVWLWVMMPHTQPPVSLDVRHPWQPWKIDKWMARARAWAGRIPWVKRRQMRLRVRAAVADAIKNRVE